MGKRNGGGKSASRVGLLVLFRTTDMFVYIIGYLDHKSVRALCNTCSGLAEEKRIFLYWELNSEFSLKYLKSNVSKASSLRRKLLTRLNRPSHQLSLRLSDAEEVNLYMLSSLDIADVSALDSVHALDLNRCLQLKDVSALGGVRYIHAEVKTSV